VSLSQNPWFTSTLRVCKSTVRRAESIWKNTHSALDWSTFKHLRSRRAVITMSFLLIKRNLIPTSTNNPGSCGKLWTTCYIVSLHHLYLPSVQLLHSQKALLLSSPIQNLHFIYLCSLRQLIQEQTAWFPDRYGQLKSYCLQCPSTAKFNPNPNPNPKFNPLVKLNPRLVNRQFKRGWCNKAYKLTSKSILSVSTDTMMPEFIQPPCY